MKIKFILLYSKILKSKLLTFDQTLCTKIHRSLLQIQMIPQIWQKSIVAEIKLYEDDIADQFSPLPLFLELSWNHYVGFYYQQIKDFFSGYVIYPHQKEQFYLVLEKPGFILNGTQIVGHLVSLYDQGIVEPIRLICHYRSKTPLPQIQLKKYFKNTLKASSSIRNQKLGASMLTFQMSPKDVQNLYESFQNNDFQGYFGNSQQNAQEKHLGYSFLISKTERVPVKIIGRDFQIQRGIPKNTSLVEFLASVFGEEHSNQQIIVDQKVNEQKTPQAITQENQNQQNKKNSVKDSEKQKKQNPVKYNYIFQKYNFYLQAIKLTRGQYSLEFFQKYCHPDGYLYIFFKQNS